jgi:hypothetical protein
MMENEEMNETTERRRPQADVLMEIVGDLQLFHSPSRECFAVINVNGHNENHSLDSTEFTAWLSRQYWEREQRMPSKQNVEDVLTQLKGRALHEWPREETHIRVAEYEQEGENQIFIDLGNEDWQAVRVTANGWEVIESTYIPVKFRRSAGAQALPTPLEGGDLEDLSPFVNVEEEDFILVLAWLVNCLRPNRPFPILALHGEHGSAKSTTSEVLRSLIDPNRAPLRSAPRNEEQLAISAHHSWVMAFDNLSGISGATSDALCRISTGGGFGTRRLYTNAEEFLFDAMRPILLNGINELATRPDLLDRSLVLHCPTILEGMRRSKDDFDSDFKDAQARILGALLSRLSEALRNLPGTEISRLPRMADFALFGTAAFGIEFYNRYMALLDELNTLAIESSAVGPLILQFMEDKQEDWEGTASELLNELEKIADPRQRGAKYFPTQPNKLSRELNRLAPNLRRAGIEVNHREHGVDRRNMVLEKLDRASSRSSNVSVDDNDDRDDQTQSLANSPSTAPERETDEGEEF